MDPSRDTLLRALSEDGSIAVRALVGTGVVAEAARRHDTGPLATAALGRVLLGAVLIAAGGKDGETVQLGFRGTGPLGTLIAVAECEGAVRGYATHRDAELPLRGGAIDVPGGVGLGELSVVRNRPSWKEPYTGIVPITSGGIASDLALYLTESEQTPAAVGLGEFLGPEGEVEVAGGYLALALPGASEEAVAQLEANVQGLPCPSYVVREGGAPAMVEGLLDGLGVRELDRTRPSFSCPCDSERVLRAVALLGPEELDEAVARQERLEVRCHFCGEVFAVAPEQARALLAGV
jgi:molecular chaperone Hsp33